MALAALAILNATALSIPMGRETFQIAMNLSADSHLKPACQAVKLKERVLGSLNLFTLAVIFMAAVEER